MTTEQPERRRRPLSDRGRVEGNGHVAGNGVGRRSRSRSSGPRVTGPTLGPEGKFNPRQPRDNRGRWTEGVPDLSTILPNTRAADLVPEGFEITEQTRTRAGVTITHLAYTGKRPDTVREILGKRRLRDLVREELALIAWDISLAVTGHTAAAKAHGDLPHPLLVEAILTDLIGMAERDEDFDDEAWVEIVNRYRAAGYGPQQKGLAVSEDTLVYENKSLPVSGFKVLSKDEGIVECIVSVTGIVDEVADVIEPGAYTKTLQRRTPKGVYSHDWNTPVAKTLSIKELMPGDPGLPSTFRGKPWPPEAGALVVKAQFNLGTQRGREAYSDVEFYGDEQEWSIGYNVPVGGSKSVKGVRYIREIDLFEFSPVLFGAMPLAGTIGAKAAAAALEQAKGANGGEVPRYMTVVVHTETKDVYAGMVARDTEHGFGEVADLSGKSKFCDRHGGLDPEQQTQCAATGRCVLTGEAIEVKAADAVAAGLITADEAKRWDPRKHPRDYRGRFISLGDIVDLPDGVGGSGNERGKVVGMADNGDLQVEKDNGDRVNVPSKQVVGHGKGDDDAKPDAKKPDAKPDAADGRRSPSRSQAAAGRKNPDEALDGISLTGSKTGKGTKDDPIDVGSDVDKAAALLAEGKHVRLDQPDQVSTLLDRLSKIVEEAKAKGDEAPNFDLCMVSVPKTNLFCAESKGIPRAKMPQLSGTPVEGSPAAALMKDGDKEANITGPFREALARMGIKVTPKTVKASHLRASQAELDGPKIAGMSKAMEAGKVPDAPIFVTRDGYIIDGHHRWASKVAIDVKDNQIGDVEMPVDVLDMDIGAALDFANEFALAMGIRPKSLGAAADGVAPDARNVTTSDAVEGKALVGSCAVLTPEEKALVDADGGTAFLTAAEVVALQRLRAELL